MDVIGLLQGVPRQVPSALARDLTLGQLRLLLLLRRDGAQPMGRIAQVLDLSSTAATGFVSRVERHGLVVRRHRSDDRRVVECALSDAGSQFVDELSGIRIDALRSALAMLTPLELARFRVLLGRVRERQERPA